jgi:hypothetical protein
MTLRFRSALASLTLGVFAVPALAQQPSAPPAQAQTQYAPSHLVLAREVAIGSGLTRSFDAIIPQFSEQIKQQAVTRPELTKDLDATLVALAPEMELQKQQMIATTARVFASRLSEAELKEVAAFFKSGAGQKYVQTQPLVLDELVREMQTWTQNVAEYLMVRVRAEMAKRGHQMQ